MKTVTDYAVGQRASTILEGRIVDGWSEVGAVKLPADAREWVDACSLSLQVQEEVESVSLAPCEPANAIACAESIRMFELLTFAYSVNVLASTAIEAACKTDPAFRFLSAGQAPFPAEITSFRRRHRRQLEDALTRTFAWLLGKRVEHLPTGLYLRLLDNARDRLDIARHFDEA